MVLYCIRYSIRYCIKKMYNTLQPKSDFPRPPGTAGTGRVEEGEEGRKASRSHEEQGQGTCTPFGGREQPGPTCSVWQQKTAAKLSASSLHRVLDRYCPRAAMQRKRGEV